MQRPRGSPAHNPGSACLGVTNVSSQMFPSNLSQQKDTHTAPLSSTTLILHHQKDNGRNQIPTNLKLCPWAVIFNATKPHTDRAREKLLELLAPSPLLKITPKQSPHSRPSLLEKPRVSPTLIPRISITSIFQNVNSGGYQFPVD